MTVEDPNFVLILVSAQHMARDDAYVRLAAGGFQQRDFFVGPIQNPPEIMTSFTLIVVVHWKVIF
jgi:hypothetical protein